MLELVFVQLDSGKFVDPLYEVKDVLAVVVVPCDETTDLLNEVFAEEKDVGA